MRLTALVLVPMLLSIWGSLTTIRHARNQAAAGSDVERTVPQVNALMQTSSALLHEAAASVLYHSLIGLPPSLLRTLSAAGIKNDYPQSQRQTDAEVAGMTAVVAPDSSFAREIRNVRTAAMSGAITPEQSLSRYLALDQGLLTRLNLLATGLAQRDQDIDTSRKIVSSVTDVANLGAAMHFLSAQSGEVGPLVTGTLTEPETVAAVGRLGSATGLFQAASDRLLNSSLPATVSQWRSVLGSADSRRFDALTTALLSGAPDQGDTVGNALILLQAWTRVQAQGNSMIAARLSTLRALSMQARQQAQRTRDTTYLVLLACLLLVIVFTWLVGLTIRRPLRRLSEGAESVTYGQLDLAEIPIRGPREIRLVTRAFNELVSNLKLLEAKSLALADLDLASPALSTPLPGRLGGAIDASVEALAASVAERDQLGRQLAHDATHDPLTGLPNRAAAVDALERALPRARRAGQPVAVLFIDLDGFKRVNDTHGHHVGDELLLAVAERMQAVVRDGEILARLGGDEFVIIAEGTDEHGAISLGDRIVRTLETSVTVEDAALPVGASIGVAIALDGTDTAAGLLQQADLALYRAKDAGRGQVVLFDAHLQQELLERTEIESALAATLSRGGDELELHYQPVIDSSTGRLDGVEALIRWNRPGHGQIPPNSFIPVAELSNLIIDLDAWTLRTAIEQAAHWRSAPGQEDFTLAVNISGRHLLAGRLIHNVQQALSRSDFPATNLVLEVTETVLITDLASVATQLAHLREIGIRVAIDDFGTGFTSLATLRTLPIDIIKVDRSFVDAIDHAATRSLVNMVTQLGHELGVIIIAEGVETAAQRNTLHYLGADQLQGFLISRPMPAAQVTERLGLIAR